MLRVKKFPKHTTKLTLTTIQIILYEIWESRNNNKNDKKLLPQHTIITKINAQLQHIITNTLQTPQTQKYRKLI